MVGWSWWLLCLHGSGVWICGGGVDTYLWACAYGWISWTRAWLDLREGEEGSGIKGRRRWTKMNDMCYAWRGLMNVDTTDELWKLSWLCFVHAARLGIWAMDCLPKVVLVDDCDIKRLVLLHWLKYPRYSFQVEFRTFDSSKVLNPAWRPLS